jgi:hypothetical protein
MDKELNRFRRLAKRLFANDDRRCHVTHRLGAAISEASKKLDMGCGAEHLVFTDEDGDECGATYLNMGDTYDHTVIAEWKRSWHGGSDVRWTLGCWGDLVERREGQGYTISC